MKFKKGAEITSSDFWYDLVGGGGYIKPEKLLEKKEDIAKVKDAIKVLKEFKQAAEDQEVLIEI